MSLSLVHSRALLGLEARPVCVEVHLANGLPSFTLVGLAETKAVIWKGRALISSWPVQRKLPPVCWSYSSPCPVVMRSDLWSWV